MWPPVTTSMSSLTNKAKSLGPRFYDYLNGLREEFELQSNPTSAKGMRPRRFNNYLEGLKFEFELLTEDIESLQKERDDFEVRGICLLCFCHVKYFITAFSMIVKEQAMEIQNIRNDVVCQGCSRGTVIPVDQPQKFLQIQNTSSSHVVNLSQQRMTALDSSQSAIIPPRSAFDTTTAYRKTIHVGSSRESTSSEFAAMIFKQFMFHRYDWFSCQYDWFSCQYDWFSCQYDWFSCQWDEPW